MGKIMKKRVSRGETLFYAHQNLTLLGKVKRSYKEDRHL